MKSDRTPRIIVSSATFDINQLDDTASKTRHAESDCFDCYDRFGDSRPEQTPQCTRARWRKTWIDSTVAWATELIWSLLSIILLMGLIMVLSTFNGQPLPDLPLGLTLNTVVAILATSSRAVTVFLIGQGISQLKWNQYVGQEKPLINLHVFDEASRGPWGSLQMVFRTRGSLLAILASLLIITSLGSSTLTQSAIAYTPRLVADAALGARVQYCNSYPCGAAYQENAQIVRNFTDNLEAAAFGTVFNSISRELPRLPPQCQSANCKWPNFDTLAVCFEMRNVTDRLEINVTQEAIGLLEHQVNTASLMDGSIFLREADDESLGYFAETVNITQFAPNFQFIGDGDEEPRFPYPRKSLAFKDDKDLLDTTFSHLFVVHNNVNTEFEKPASRYRAAEVLMHFCVSSLDVAVDQGASSTRSTQTHTRVSHINEATFSINGGGEPGYLEVASADDKKRFKLMEFLDLDRDLGKAFSGYYTARLTREETETGQMARQLGLNMFQGLNFTTPAPDADEKVWNNLKRVFGTIATGMTDYMREAGLESQGTAFTSVTFVEVRWEWLTMVAAQVVLSIAFLLTVMVGTANLGVDVVKSSNLAELFAMPHALCKDCCQTREDLSDNTTAVRGGIKTEVGKNIGAVLTKKDDGWRLEVVKQNVGV